MADDNHEELTGFGSAHIAKKNTTQGGACLNGRCKATYDTVSCSYRYQGIEAAKANAEIYNAKGIDEVFHVGKGKAHPRTKIIAAISKSGNRREMAIHGKYYALKGAEEKRYPPPKRLSDGEIYEQHKDDQAVVKKAFSFVNFTIGSVPYPNQVHHILNHSSLRNVVNSFKNIRDVIAQGLLKETYNINHKNNMCILPTKDAISRLVGLPVHGGHPNYNIDMLDEVEKAFKGYEKINQDAENKSHPKPSPEPVAEELYFISKTWYEKIIDTVPGNKIPGAKLTKIDDLRK